jgi:hypothetical protein
LTNTQNLFEWSCNYDREVSSIISQQAYQSLQPVLFSSSLVGASQFCLKEYTVQAYSFLKGKKNKDGKYIENDCIPSLTTNSLIY